MNFNPQDLMDSFVVMEQGMAGIFIVLITISLIVTLLAKLTNRKSKETDK